MGEGVCGNNYVSPLLSATLHFSFLPAFLPEKYKSDSIILQHSPLDAPLTPPPSTPLFNPAPTMKDACWRELIHTLKYFPDSFIFLPLWSGIEVFLD